MKSSILLSILIACIILWSGCSTGKIQTDGEALPKEDNATEITIEVRDYGTNFYVNAAKKFEEETGVKVNVINGFVGQSSENLSASIERIQAELMAGKGADIYANTYLDYASIGKNKHLCNIANWIANDPSFSDDAYYMDILKSGFDEGDVYSVPLFMNFQAMGSSIEVPELDGQSLNWEEFIELTKGIKRSSVLCNMTDYEIFKLRFRDRYDQFIIQENKTQNLDSSEMRDLLEQCKKWSMDGLCIPFNSENYTEMAENSFFKLYGGDIEFLTNFRFDNPYLDDEPYIYDIPTDSGKNDKANKISPTDIICINAASPYKGTAWKFIKFLLSEDIQATGFSTPVNRKAAENHINKSLNETISYFGLDADADKIFEESEVILDAVDKISNNIPGDIEKIVLKEAKRFFTNEISSEAATKNMAAGVKLYFKEQ